VDGVVCGHIHTAEFRTFEFEGKPVEYWNDGDWVEGCNALVEHHDGRMEILNWPDVIRAREEAAAAAIERTAAAAMAEAAEADPDPKREAA
jgi:hypothetical protein